MRFKKQSTLSLVNPVRVDRNCLQRALMVNVITVPFLIAAEKQRCSLNWGTLFNIRRRKSNSYCGRLRQISAKYGLVIRFLAPRRQCIASSHSLHLSETLLWQILALLPAKSTFHATLDFPLTSPEEATRTQLSLKKSFVKTFSPLVH